MRFHYLKIFGALVITTFSLSCAIMLKPCTKSADFAGLPGIQGNKQCNQKKMLDGSWVNHGEFIQWYPNGQVAYIGEFDEGRKNGKWTFYNPEGIRVLEKIYEMNIEKSSQTFGYNIVDMLQKAQSSTSSSSGVSGGLSGSSQSEGAQLQSGALFQSK